MYAMTYQGPGAKSWTEHPDPELRAPTDAIVRVDAVTICGTDLHILAGDVPEVPAGTVLGHEAVGTVVRHGSACTGLEIGDRVLISCITACGTCRFCREARYGQCLGGGGWQLGHRIDGTQAEFVRVPFADMSTHRVPPDLTGQQALMMADILPTGFEIGVLAGEVRPDDVVVIVGAGPIGAAAVMTARLYSPRRIVFVDVTDNRLAAARRVGADTVINSAQEDPRAIVDALTDGLGADVTIEAVGVPETFELAVDLVRPGGHVANIGVHGAPATLHLEKIWIRDLTITTGLVDTRTTPALLSLTQRGKLDPAALVTHEFTMDAFDLAYEVFANPHESGALKVVIARD